MNSAKAAIERKNRHKVTLSGVTLFALIAHIVCVWSINDLHIEVSTGNGGGFLTMASQQEEKAKQSLPIESAIDRNQQLAQAFKEMQEARKPKQTDFDFYSVGTQLMTQLDQLPSDLDDVIKERNRELVTVDEELVAPGYDTDLAKDLASSTLAAPSVETDEGLASTFLEATQSVPGMSSHAPFDSIANSAEEYARADMLERMDELGSRGTAGERGQRPSDRYVTDGDGTIANSQDFRMATRVMPAPDGNGYLFELAFSPREEVRFRRVRQNVFFLIDRSHSIRSVRYDAAREAVSQALDYLESGDTFNILIFDKKVVRLAESNLKWNAQSLKAARQFLKQQQHGGMFASTDLYSSLGKIVPKAVADDEVNTAILFSDGVTYLTADAQRRAISKWTQQNSHKVSLYTVASGKNNNVALLDLISSANKGTLAYSSTDKGLTESGLALLKKIKDPIGKDLSASVVSTGDANITIYPSAQCMPDLYKAVPYRLYGRIDKLEDFHVFLQGKFYDRWFDIRQRVSFGKAEQADSQLVQMVAVQEANKHYLKFLDGGRNRELAQARKLLHPFKVSTAFQ